MTQSTAGASASAISREWQVWIAENLLRGVEPNAIAQLLVEHGVEPATAASEVTSAASHPYVQAAAGVVDATRRTTTATGGSTRAAKYAWWLEVMRRSARQATDWGEIPRLNRPATETLLNEHYAMNRPCVIEGAMEGWPALTRWTAEHFRTAYGDQRVEVEVYVDPDAEATGNTARRREEMLLRDFVDIVEDGSRVHGHYMTANNSEHNAEAFAGLWNDVIWPDFLQGEGHPLSSGWLWYGPKGSFTPLHHDLTNNLMAQFRGRKLVKLVAPFESAHIYNHEHRYSNVDLDAVDLEAFPEMADVTIFETIIEPGDMLFIPAGWWHTVRALDVSVTVTFANFVWDTDHYSHYTTFDAID